MMWEELLSKCARILAPFERYAATGPGEMNLSVSATHIVIAIPEWMRGRYCEFQGVGAAVDVLFGTSSSVEVVYNQASSVDGTTKVVTIDTKTGRHVPDGDTRSWLVPANATHMAAEASGNGTLHVGPSSAKL